MRVVTLRAAVMLALLGPAACAVSQSDGNPYGEAGEVEEVTIRIDNENSSNVTVYALAAALRERLGQVPGRNRREFTIDWDIRRNLSIGLEFTDGGRCTVGPWQVQPGIRIDVEVPSNRAMIGC